MPFFMEDNMNHINTHNISQEQLEECLQLFKDKKFDDYKLHHIFPNTLLRSDVLNLLDMYCTVVYYPLEEDNNNGFHIKDVPFLDGTLNNHFVFINTAQTIDKQVFTAAHELGHIWNVDDYVVDKLNLSPNATDREMIINKFAAVLLMPKEPFKKFFDVEYEKLVGKNPEISIDDFLKLCTILMNHFFAPFKSIVTRFFELELLSKEDYDLVLNTANPTWDKAINLSLRKHLLEQGYTQFLESDKRKWIDGLPELLNKVEKNQLMSTSKLSNIRNRFGLEPIDVTQPISEKLSFSTQKEIGKNDN